MSLIKYFILFIFYSAAQGLNVRIKGGEDTSGALIPYVVSLQHTVNSSHFCGGSILNENYVLTAAHCVAMVPYDGDPSVITITTGPLRTAPLSKHTVTKIRKHHYAIPTFGTHPWDIAVVKVTPPFKFNRYISSVKLPKSKAREAAGTKALVSGWGRQTYKSDVSPKKLKNLRVTIIDHEECKKRYIGYPRMIIAENLYICTHEKSGPRRGPCKGDSGGPLIINKNTIIGIVSTGIGYDPDCGSYPTVYTRVSENIDWILESMQD